MAKYGNKPINSLLTNKVVSVNSDSNLNTLRKRFDENFILWKSLSPGDPQRQILAGENEKIISMILSRC